MAVSNAQREMADAITAVFARRGTFWTQLSDEELLDFSAVLNDYLGDLRDEWSRREMLKQAANRGTN